MAEGYNPVIQRMAIYQNLSFTFDNANYSLKDVADIDSNLGNAKLIFAFNRTNSIPFIANLNGAKTVLQLTALDSLNQSYNVNLLAIY